MNNNLIGRLRVMAAAGLMVGCTNFSDFQNTVELDVQGNYESAFVQRFGQPSAEQDWGFSDRVASTRATEAEWTQYAKSADYYLDGLTEAEMQQYNAFTDDDITSQGFIFGTSTMGNTRAATRAVGDAIDGNSYFRVSVGFNPTDGQDAYMYNGSNVVGILTFGGTGNAAESSATFSDYPAKIVRPYIIFKPLVDNQWYSGAGAITTYYENRGNSAKLIIYDMTDNKYIRGGGEWDFTYEMLHIMVVLQEVTLIRFISVIMSLYLSMAFSIMFKEKCWSSLNLMIILVIIPMIILVIIPVITQATTPVITQATTKVIQRSPLQSPASSIAWQAERRSRSSSASRQAR